MVQIMIKVKSGDLLQQLKVNRVTHIQEYEEAMVGFWNKYEERLQKALAKLALMKKPTDEGPDLHPLHGLVKPQSHEEDYDLVISMLTQTSEDDDIELGSDQYKQLWLDDWDWKGHFTATNSMYAS